MTTFKDLLLKLDACQEARDWAADKSWEEVYNTCHRGDWLLWLFKNTNPNDLQLLTLAKGHCANTVRHLMEDERSLQAVDAAIAFGEGKISREELDAAAAAAYAAASAAASAAAYIPAAAYAAYADYAAAAYAASIAAAYSSSTAYISAASAASAAYADYAASARQENLQLTADICRKYLPIEVWNIKP